MKILSYSITAPAALNMKDILDEGADVCILLGCNDISNMALPDFYNILWKRNDDRPECGIGVVWKKSFLLRTSNADHYNGYVLPLDVNGDGLTKYIMACWFPHDLDAESAAKCFLKAIDENAFDFSLCISVALGDFERICHAPSFEKCTEMLDDLLFVDGSPLTDGAEGSSWVYGNQALENYACSHIPIGTNKCIGVSFDLVDTPPPFVTNDMYEPGMKEFTIPFGCKVLWYSFDGFNDVEKVIIDTELDMDDDCGTHFGNMPHLKEFEVINDSAFFTRDGVLFYDTQKGGKGKEWLNASFSSCTKDLNGNILVAFPPQKDVSRYSIPEGTVGIASSAFVNCQIEELSIPDSVLSVGVLALNGLPNLSVLHVSTNPDVFIWDHKKEFKPVSIECDHTDASLRTVCECKWESALRFSSEDN